MISLDNLRVEHLEPLVDELFAVDGDGSAPLALRLAEVRRLPAHSGHVREPFALTFRGPLAPLLPPRIYTFSHAALGALDIFIVPIGQDQAGTTYEAIFT